MLYLFFKHAQMAWAEYPSVRDDGTAQNVCFAKRTHAEPIPENTTVGRFFDEYEQPRIAH